MTDKWLAILNDDSDRLICQSTSRSFSVAQLRQRINHLQAIITRQKHRNWVLYDDNGFRFICALFALLSSGRNALIPAGHNKNTIKKLLESGGELIGHHPELREYIAIETSPDEKFEDSDLDVEVASSGEWGQLAFQTSGSSGAPKVITKSVEQLYLEVKKFNLTWKPTSNTLFIPLVPHLHLYGLTFAFLLPLLARAGFYLPRNGGLLGVVEPITPNSGHPPDELAVITSPTIGRQAEHISVLAEPGSVARDDRPAPVSRVFCAGGKLTAANARQIIDIFDCPVTEIFGSTETGGVATREHHRQQHQDTDNPWQLLPGLEATTLKDDNHKVPDSRGELLVWGGHVGGSKKTPVTTGDEVRFLDHCRFELLGRRGQICKIEGKRISITYLVEILEKCQLVAETAILPFVTNDKEVLLCGVVLSIQGESCYRSSGKFFTDSLIRKHLREFLDPVLVPKTIRYFDKMPRNEMGKLPQQRLIELLVNPEFPSLPLIGMVRNNPDTLVLSLRIPMELRYLKGHFENRPIVPGVVLLQWVYHFIDEYWKLPMNTAIVNFLKFSKPVTPGDNLTLTLRLIKNAVSFLYQDENKTKFSSGSIPLNPEAVDV